MATGMDQAGEVECFDQGDDGITQGSQHRRSLTAPHPTSVFAHHDIARPVEFVFNVPMRSPAFQHRQ